MKIYLFALSLFIFGCQSYSPEKYIGEDYTEFWFVRNTEFCPKCEEVGYYERSFASSLRERPIKFIYYYSCSKHSWVVIESDTGDAETHLLKD